MDWFALVQPAALLFVCGLALVWTSGLAFQVARGARRTSSSWFAAFALAQGLAQWLLLVASRGGPASDLLSSISLALSGASFLALLEYGRREFRGRDSALPGAWVYGILAAIAVIAILTGGMNGVRAVVRYELALVGGCLAAAALGQQAKRSGTEWATSLASAATALFAIGFIFSIQALQAFAALGLVAGLWRDNRNMYPVQATASAVRRWGSPAGFIVLTIAGAVGIAALAERPEGEMLVGVSLAPGGSASAADVSLPWDEADLDPREAARKRACEQRNKQGLAMLIVLVVVGVVWAGVARHAGRSGAQHKRRPSL